MAYESIQLSRLQSSLWETANILREPVDAADFKTYIFPLLFFKRLSDVYDEEYAIANLKDSLQAAYSAEDRLKELLKRIGLLT